MMPSPAAEHRWYARGKLLLTAEYAVLEGAPALALPCRLGQWLHARPEYMECSSLHWQSFDHQGNIWFEGQYHHDSARFEYSTHEGVACTLANIFEQLSAMGAEQALRRVSKLTTHLEFDRHWGLGSSSTLLSLLSQWAGTDAYVLSDATLGGSGYDIACATADGPIVFERLSQQRLTRSVVFAPTHRERWHLVYRGQKQNSRSGIALYRQVSGHVRQRLVRQLGDLTLQLLTIQHDYAACAELLTEHETLLSMALGLPKVGIEIFPDFGGVVKQLGAWGGDFMLALSALPTLDVSAYFRAKGYPVVIPLPELCLLSD